MANITLRQALQNAGIQPDELADALGVDERTVRRWLAGGAPYARHRAQIARALDATEEQLWPHLIKAAQADTDPAPTPVGETVVAYPVAGAGSAARPEDLIAGAHRQIDVIDSDKAAPLAAELIELLVARARGGCQVRILVSRAGPSLVPLLTTPGIEIRRSQPDERCASHRADDDILVRLTLDPGGDQGSPMLLRVNRDQAPGSFARLIDYYEQAWEQAEPNVNSDDLAHDSGQAPQPARQPPATQPAVTWAAGAPRRWPGRPK